MDKIEKKELACISKRIVNTIIYAFIGVFIGALIGYMVGSILGLLLCKFVVGDCENAGIILLPSLLIGIVVSMIQFGVMAALDKFSWNKALQVSFAIVGILILAFLLFTFVVSI